MTETIKFLNKSLVTCFLASLFTECCDFGTTTHDKTLRSFGVSVSKFYLNQNGGVELWRSYFKVCYFLFIMSKRVHTTASSRLKQDYSRIKKDPVPYVTAAPLPTNILEWYVSLLVVDKWYSCKCNIM